MLSGHYFVHFNNIQSRKDLTGQRTTTQVHLFIRNPQILKETVVVRLAISSLIDLPDFLSIASKSAAQGQVAAQSGSSVSSQKPEYKTGERS